MEKSNCLFDLWLGRKAKWVFVIGGKRLGKEKKFKALEGILGNLFGFLKEKKWKKKNLNPKLPMMRDPNKSMLFFFIVPYYYYSLSSPLFALNLISMYEFKPTLDNKFPFPPTNSILFHFTLNISLFWGIVFKAMFCFFLKEKFEVKSIKLVHNF